MSFREHFLFNEIMKSVDEISVSKVVEDILITIKRQGRIFFAGNGGSGSIGEHFVSDLIKGSGEPLPIAINAYSLNSNQVVMSAISNDHGYEHCFTDQLRMYKVKPSDLLICFSVSGSSKNILSAMSYAHNKRVNLVLFSGVSSEEDVLFSGYKQLHHVHVCDPNIITKAGVDGITSALWFGLVEGVFSCLAHVIPVRVRQKIMEGELSDN